MNPFALTLSVVSLLLASPPAELVCLARHYSFTLVEVAPGRWAGQLADGTQLVAENSPQATLDERALHPALRDLWVLYRRGPARPIENPDEDPGRIRSDALFDATYGRVPELRTVQVGGARVRVSARIAPALERVAHELAELAKHDPRVARAIAHPAGGYNARNIAHSTFRSAHSWGIAVDLDTSVADYWGWAKERTRWRNRMPQSIVDAFEAEGFIWGGRWYHFDTMHFEYRPELLDPACAPPSP